MKQFPDGTKLPHLPAGYEWVCLQKIESHNPNMMGKWWIRIKWIMADGRKRNLLTEKPYYATPEEAIQDAYRTALIHSGTQMKKGYRDGKDRRT